MPHFFHEGTRNVRHSCARNTNKGVKIMTKKVITLNLVEGSTPADCIVQRENKLTGVREASQRVLYVNASSPGDLALRIVAFILFLESILSSTGFFKIDDF